MFIHTHTCTHTYTYIHTHMHTRAHTSTCTHTHTNIHTHIHIHTHVNTSKADNSGPHLLFLITDRYDLIPKPFVNSISQKTAERRLFLQGSHTPLYTQKNSREVNTEIYQTTELNREMMKK